VSLDAVAHSFDLGPVALSALSHYVDLLGRYEAANVTGARGRPEMVERLVGDSLALLDVEELTARAEGGVPLADLGAGAGIPGIPLALALPSLRVTLIESVGKKCLFLERAVATCGLRGRVRVACQRGERLAAVGSDGREAFSVVLAKAVGPLATVVELAAPLLVAGGVLLASKTGRALEAERPRPAARRTPAALAPRRLRVRRVREDGPHARLATSA
jgi:16S rRNA (guanine527-N7)-methyltransferase